MTESSSGQGPGQGRRLDGWKAIAGYFRRDRTTVMRWMRERQLPVRRLPGGKQGSVFAFEHELAVWALGQDDVEPVEAVAPVTPSPDPPAPRRRHWLWLTLPALLAAALGGLLLWGARAPNAEALPADPAVAADYVAARDAWARRTPADLAEATKLYSRVIARDPRFAPAHAGLAEAWLIRREYGEVDDPTAYQHARDAAERALVLDGNLPAAHRARGFVLYWWTNRAEEAVAAFRRAIALDRRDAQSHFWYANVLADLGEDAEAQRHYDRARLLSPGSRAIAVEQACSHWQAGRDAQALAELGALSERYPGDATIRNCLAWVHISRGDIRSFAREYAAAASDRGEPQFLAMTQRLLAAADQDPAHAHRVVIAYQRGELARGARRVRETPAFFASAAGDRALLVELLREARRMDETWHSASVRRRIATRWRGDREIERLLAAVTPTPVRI